MSFLSLRIEPEIKERLIRLAERERRSLTSMIKVLIVRATEEPARMPTKTAGCPAPGARVGKTPCNGLNRRGRRRP